MPWRSANSAIHLSSAMAQTSGGSRLAKLTAFLSISSLVPYHATVRITPLPKRDTPEHPKPVVDQPDIVREFELNPAGVAATYVEQVVTNQRV